MIVPVEVVSTPYEAGTVVKIDGPTSEYNQCSLSDMVTYVIKLAVSVVKNNAVIEKRLEIAEPRRLQRARRPVKNEITAKTRDMR